MVISIHALSMAFAWPSVALRSTSLQRAAIPLLVADDAVFKAPSLDAQLEAWISSDAIQLALHSDGDDASWSEDDEIEQWEDTPEACLEVSDDAPEHARPLSTANEADFVARALREEAHLGPGSQLPSCAPSNVASVVEACGVAHVDGVLSPTTAAKLRSFVLDELDRTIAAGRAAAHAKADSPSHPACESAREGEDEGDDAFRLVAVGSGTQRLSRWVSLDEEEQGGVPDGEGEGGEEERRWDIRLSTEHPIVRQALAEVLADGSALGTAFETLGGRDAALWEVACIVSSPGAAPQIVHADAVWTPEPLLITCFIALQPVTRDMGPTRFLPHTHTDEAHAKVVEHADATHLRRRPSAVAGEPSGELGGSAADEAPPSCVALLGIGDGALYDGRLLHCGGANRSGERRLQFYLTLRRPPSDAGDTEEGGLDPEQDCMDEWEGKVTLGQLRDELASS